MIPAAMRLIVAIGKETQESDSPIQRFCPEDSSLLDALIHDGIVAGRKTTAFEGSVYHNVILTTEGWGVFFRLTSPPPSGYEGSGRIGFGRNSS